MHILGFNHIGRDPENPCDCHHDDCVMQGGVSPFADYYLFTPCQEDQLISYATNEKYDCLLRKPDLPLYEPYCGDGAINQDWEECDCHGINCDNKCYCTDDCKLRLDGDVCFENATVKSICADNICRTICNKGDMCCDEFGFIKAEGSLCYPGGIEDDPCEPRCDGVTSGSCPIQMINGAGCKRFGFYGKCYRNRCQSFEIQCASIFGKDVVSKAPDDCMKKNTDGTEYGNCGINEDSTFNACSPKKKQYRCGKLFCSVTSSDPASLIKVPSDEEVNVHSFDIGGQKCYSISSLMTEDGVDLSYTKNGTDCNPGVSHKFCMGGECLYKTLLEEFKDL
ncbi:zinc metalloproteinase-disintegrin-like 2d [Convolutriloba macropyga]|uniref:zinc metalloproteinase-disintegrin-like 2d n=1 Tax=Convolutriloba macropyga TaxID=536237 RepID=UPI003F51E548